MKLLFIIIALAIGAFASGCAMMHMPKDTGDDFQTYNASPTPLLVSGLTVYGDHRGPTSYRTQTKPFTKGEIREIRAKECQTGIFVNPAILFGSWSFGAIGATFGEGGHADALKVFRKTHKDIIDIFDVKVDYEILSVLGIVNKLCVRINAKAIVPPGSDTSRRLSAQYKSTEVL